MEAQKEIHPDLYAKVEDAYVRLDSALPTLYLAVEWLRDTNEARQCALALFAIKEAHALLHPIYSGEE